MEILELWFSKVRRWQENKTNNKIHQQQEMPVWEVEEKLWQALINSIILSNI